MMQGSGSSDGWARVGVAAGVIGALAAVTALVVTFVGAGSHAEKAGGPVDSSLDRGAAEEAESHWKGVISIGVEGLDFDTTPPHEDPDRSEEDLVVNPWDSSESGPAFETWKRAAIAKWTGPSKPTAQECAEIIADEGVSLVTATGRGGYYCIVSTGGNLAAFTFDGWVDYENDFLACGVL